MQSAYQFVSAFRFYRTSTIKGYVKITIFGQFGHFGLKIGPLPCKNCSKNLSDCKTRALELTVGAISMILSQLVEI